MEKKNINPFLFTWNIISTISGAVGLVSFTKNIFQWKGFINELVSHYRFIVYGFFSWFPFDIYDWIKDYLFFGFLIVSSFWKGHKIGVELELGDNGREVGVGNVIGKTFVLLFLVPFWPLLFLSAFSSIFGSSEGQDYTEWLADKEKGISTFQWLGAIVLIFFSLLIISIMT